MHSVKPLFNEGRVSEVSEAVASALRPHIANTYKSTADEASANTSAFKSGLTSGEFHIAILRALAVLQAEQTAVIAGLLIDNDGEESAEGM